MPQKSNQKTEIHARENICGSKIRMEGKKKQEKKMLENNHGNERESPTDIIPLIRARAFRRFSSES